MCWEIIIVVVLVVVVSIIVCWVLAPLFKHLKGLLLPGTNPTHLVNRSYWARDRRNIFHTPSVTRDIEESLVPPAPVHIATSPPSYDEAVKECLVILKIN